MVEPGPCPLSPRTPVRRPPRSGRGDSAQLDRRWPTCESRSLTGPEHSDSRAIEAILADARFRQLGEFDSDTLIKELGRRQDVRRLRPALGGEPRAAPASPLRSAPCRSPASATATDPVDHPDPAHRSRKLKLKRMVKSNASRTHLKDRQIHTSTLGPKVGPEQRLRMTPKCDLLEC